MNRCSPKTSTPIYSCRRSVIAKVPVPPTSGQLLQCGRSDSAEFNLLCSIFRGTKGARNRSGLLRKQPLPVMVYRKISMRDDHRCANFLSMNTRERHVQYIMIYHVIMYSLYARAWPLEFTKGIRLSEGSSWYRFAPGNLFPLPGDFLPHQWRMNVLATCSISNRVAKFRERFLWHLLHFETGNWPVNASVRA